MNPNKPTGNEPASEAPVRLERVVSQQLTKENKKKHMALIAECAENTARGLMSESMAWQLISESRAKLLASQNANAG